MRALVENKFSDNKKYVELYGTSSDSKPTTGIVMGSVFVEVDTGKVFLFNEDSSAWVEMGA
jgi:hypothetical protein